MTCPHCGGLHPAEARFCPVTGQPLTSSQSSAQLGPASSVVAAALPDVAAVARRLLFMGPVLNLISQGKFFRRAFAIALRVLAAIAGLVGLVGWVEGWKMVADLQGAGILGGIIFQMLFLIAIYMVVHTLLIRARDVAGLSAGEFTITFIVSIFLKLIGDVCACFMIVLAIGGGILIWFTGSLASPLLSELTPFPHDVGKGTFIDGLMFMVLGSVGAFFVLVFFYWLSELASVGVAIARNTEVTRRIAEQYDKTK